MKRIAAVLLAIVGLAAGSAAPVSAQDQNHPRIVYDDKWCRLMLPGRSLAAARDRCVQFLSSTWATSYAYSVGEDHLAHPGKGYVLPSTLIETLVFNGAMSMGIADGKGYVEWFDVPPEPVSEPTPPAPVGEATPPGPDSVPVPPSPDSAPTSQVLGTGVFIVGTEIAPGIYRTAGPDVGRPSCDYARLSGPSGGNNVLHVKAQGPAVVEVSSFDLAFQTLGCQPWIPVGS